MRGKQRTLPLIARQGPPQCPQRRQACPTRRVSAPAPLLQRKLMLHLLIRERMVCSSAGSRPAAPVVANLRLAPLASCSTGTHTSVWTVRCRPAPPQRRRLLLPLRRRRRRQEMMMAPHPLRLSRCAASSVFSGSVVISVAGCPGVPGKHRLPPPVILRRPQHRPLSASKRRPKCTPDCLSARQLSTRQSARKYTRYYPAGSAGESAAAPGDAGLKADCRLSDSAAGAVLRVPPLRPPPSPPPHPQRSESRSLEEKGHYRLSPAGGIRSVRQIAWTAKAVSAKKAAGVMRKRPPLQGCCPPSQPPRLHQYLSRPLRLLNCRVTSTAGPASLAARPGQACCSSCSTRRHLPRPLRGGLQTVCPPWIVAMPTARLRLQRQSPARSCRAAPAPARVAGAAVMRLPPEHPAALAAAAAQGAACSGQAGEAAS